MLERECLPCGQVVNSRREQCDVFGQILRLPLPRHNTDNAASRAMCDTGEDDRSQRGGHDESTGDRWDEVTAEAFKYGGKRCGHEEASYRPIGPTRQRWMRPSSASQSTVRPSVSPSGVYAIPNSLIESDESNRCPWSSVRSISTQTGPSPPNNLAAAASG